MKNIDFLKLLLQKKVIHDELISGKNLTPEELETKSLCEKSLLLFVEKSWSIIEGNAPFIYGWHVQAICEHLEYLYHLYINRLIINCPPRVGKSNICSVIFPAWVWINDPSLRFLYSSYAQSLSVRDSAKCRRLIQSNWYQRLWGSKFTLTDDMNSKLRFENDKTGYRIASSVGGSNTGQGAHFEICDDPNNVVNIDSEVIREGTNEWHDFVMSSRYSGTMDQFRRLVVQQRTHEKDVTGNILAKDDARWIHLCLPMEFEKNRQCVTVPLRSTEGKRWKDPRKKEGELLWPQGVDRESLELFKTKDFHNDSYRIAGQLQQRPSPAGGGILKKEWFKPWKQRELPEFDYILQSWDTALTASITSCYSACSTWGVFQDRGGINNIMLLSIFRERIEYPDLRKMATRLYNNYEDTYIDEPLLGVNKPDLVLIEAKVSGYSLLADLMSANIPVMRFNPGKNGDKNSSGKRRLNGDKIGRCRIISHLIENGLVWLPTELPNYEFYTADSEIFLEAAINFPMGESLDIIDSMSQAFIWFISRGWVYNKEDPQPEKAPPWEKDLRPYT
jgi:phage terminase large subunit-like protein